MRAHAVKNELLPLRTVVQLLYFEQDKGTNSTTSHHKLPKPHELLLRAKPRPNTRESHGKQSLGPDKEEFKREEGRDKDQRKIKRSDSKLPLELEKKMAIKGEVEEVASEKGREVKEESISGGSKLDLDTKKIMRRTSSRSDYGREKGR